MNRNRKHRTTADHALTYHIKINNNSTCNTASRAQQCNTTNNIILGRLATACSTPTTSWALWAGMQQPAAHQHYPGQACNSLQCTNNILGSLATACSTPTTTIK